MSVLTYLYLHVRERANGTGNVGLWLYSVVVYELGLGD
jgi:hypothetical protein